MRSVSSFKVYSIDKNESGEQQEADKKAILTAAARRRDAGQNDRYFSNVSFMMLLYCALRTIWAKYWQTLRFFSLVLP